MMQSPTPQSSSPTTPEGQMLAQRGLFDGPVNTVNPRLYARVIRGKADITRTTLALRAGGEVDTDTYFGRFVASYWQQSTAATIVTVGLRYQTTGQLRVDIIAGDSNGKGRTVATTTVSGDGELHLDADLTGFLDGGALWLRFRALRGDADIEAVGWTVAEPPRRAPLAVAICTFNRPVDCLRTIGALAGDDVVAESVTTVIVVDQGTALVSEQPGFDEISRSLGPRLHYLRQPNLGGAGGFTRGLVEATARLESPDIILMDDDITCEPETVLRLGAFAAATVEPTLVGAQMLYLMRPDRLHVSAERADLSKLQAGRWAPNSKHNTSMVKKNQNRRVDADYNAWWTCLIPAAAVGRIGLPIPMFFQWDDIEFGIRARERGFATVTLANAGVWHADFDRKDRDDWAKYFSIRNSLITAALHSDIDSKAMAKRLGREILQYLVSMQYGLALTTIRGVEDFLAGPEILKDGGASALPAIRAERAKYPETVMHPASSIPGVAASQMTTWLRAPEPKKSLIDAVLVKRLINQWRGRTIPGINRLPAGDGIWWHASLFEHVVVTDLSQDGVRVRRRDPQALRTLTRRTLRLIKAFRGDAPSVARRYRDALPDLSSEENWRRLFG